MEPSSLPPERAPDEALARTVAAGRAGFRARFEAHRQQQDLARTEATARELVGRWARLVQGYSAALASDPSRSGTARTQLVQFVHTLEPSMAKLLRERGESFGLPKGSNLARVLADRQPERAVVGLVTTWEAETRAYVAEQQARREQEQRAQQSRQRESRGPGMSR